MTKENWVDLVFEVRCITTNSFHKYWIFLYRHFSSIYLCFLGLVGLKGDTGFPGEPGIAGEVIEIKGAKGERGDSGLVGLPGSVGPKGNSFKIDIFIQKNSLMEETQNLLSNEQ